MCEICVSQQSNLIDEDSHSHTHIQTYSDGFRVDHGGIFVFNELFPKHVHAYFPYHFVSIPFYLMTTVRKSRAIVFGLLYQAHFPLQNVAKLNETLLQNFSHSLSYSLTTCLRNVNTSLVQQKRRI